MLDEAVCHLLPTPTAVPYGNNQSPSPGAAVRPSLDSLAPLLPTPAARDWKSGDSNIMDRNARPLNEVITNLLPTPSVADGTGGRHSRSRQDGRGGELLLPGLVKDLDGGGDGLPRSSGGNDSPDQHPTLFDLDDEADHN
jgi:DNA (cytosine-5)-methyltransferase 1